MKKIIKELFAFLLIISVSGISAGAVGEVWADEGSPLQVGDVIGKVLSTDIRTYIDGVSVPSYNINGHTAVILQRLDNHGFSVEFDEKSRVVSVFENGRVSANEADYFLPDSQNLPIGTPVEDVLYTDIVAVFDGQPMESFNINGLTAVYIRELAEKCGAQYVWDESERKVLIHHAEQKYNEVGMVNTRRMLPGKITAVTQALSQRRWGEEPVSHLIANSDGTYFAVEIDENINVEKYDSKFNFITSFAISKEMELFGGLYSGEKYNYIAFGQENPEEDDSKEVIRIVVYDKNFVKISEVPISDCRTTVPFDASSGEMCENERYLILHTSRSQYKDENGQCPQTQLSVIIDKHTWKPCNPTGKFQYNHTSHALRELAAIDTDGFVTVDLSDAAPARGVILRKMFFDGIVETTQLLFNIYGESGANATGVMPGGLFVSDDSYLVALSSINQSESVEYGNENINGMDREIRDVYLLATDKETLEQKHYNITNYTGDSTGAGTPYLIPVNKKRAVVLWQEFSQNGEAQGIRYAIADAKKGLIKVSGLLHSVNGKDTILLSPDCKPVFADDKIIWYINTHTGRKFYCIDLKELKEYIEIPFEEKADDNALLKYKNKEQ